MSEVGEITKIGLEEAVDSLTVGEVKTIERHYGKAMEGGMTGTEMTSGVVWALERRRLLGQENRPDWADIDDWSMKKLNAYFATDEIEIDPADPETESGKDDSPDA